MTLRVPRHQTALVQAVLARLSEHVATAQTAPDTHAMRAALTECHFAIHDAMTAIQQAEDIARSDRRLQTAGAVA
jgi:hypothetical protein